jgi:hypothetical protein
MALHWGPVKTGSNGDVLGAEVHRVFRLESIQVRDQADLTTYDIALPVADRIVVTKQGLERLSVSDQAKFKYAGKFLLKGFNALCELWVLPK